MSVVPFALGIQHGTMSPMDVNRFAYRYCRRVRPLNNPSAVHDIALEAQDPAHIVLLLSQFPSNPAAQSLKPRNTRLRSKRALHKIGQRGCAFGGADINVRFA